MPPVAVRVAVLPAQTVGLLAVGVGFALTVTTPLAVALHPAALVAVTEYVPAVVVVMLDVVALVLHR